MYSVFKKLSGRRILLLGILAIGVSFANLLITSKASKAYRIATAGIYASRDSSPMDNVQALLLYSTGFYGSGGFSCSTFSFIARADNGLETVHAQVRQGSPAAEIKVSEITRGVGSEFSKSCSRPLSGLAPRQLPGRSGSRGWSLGAVSGGYHEKGCARDAADQNH